MDSLEIIRPDGDLKREVWRFNLFLPYGGNKCICFNSYAFQTRETTRHRKWISQTKWNRTMRRENTIPQPPLPDDVEAEVRKTFANRVSSLPIIK